MTAEPLEEPTKLVKRFRQVEAGDGPARSDHQTRFRRRRQHNARYFEPLDALCGEQAGNAFGAGLPVKHQSGRGRLRNLRAESVKMLCHKLAPLLVELIQSLDAPACSISVPC